MACLHGVRRYQYSGVQKKSKQRYLAYAPQETVRKLRKILDSFHHHILQYMLQVKILTRTPENLENSEESFFVGIHYFLGITKTSDVNKSATGLIT